MFDLMDVLSYVVMLTFEFTSLCAITKVARGWFPQLGALVVIVAMNLLLECWYEAAGLPLAEWTAAFFAIFAVVFFVLVLVLSRDVMGRRIFLALAFAAYAAWSTPAFIAVAYRNIFGLTEFAACMVGLVVIIVESLFFLFVFLPMVPRGGRGFHWRFPCVAASVTLAALFVTGLWPISLITAPTRYCLAFLFESVVAWVLFPMTFRLVRDYEINTTVENDLALMTAEVQHRRTAIDEARRLRHDERHHRVQVAEYLMHGQTDAALAYLRELDAEAKEMSRGETIWCGNETVNAILSGYARKAAEAGVPFEAEAHVEPAMDLPDIELVAVLGNLIENAINACVRNAAATGATGEQRIRVSLRQHPLGIRITVENPVPAAFSLTSDGLPCTIPGIGMESIRRVVKKHQGEWNYQLENGVLTAQVVLMFCD